MQNKVALWREEAKDALKLYQDTIPLFDLHRIETRTKKMMSRKVWLKNGGNLIIDETEAMTVFDVNTAKTVPKKKFEKTVTAMNIEAAEKIARILRFRNISGIIIIDFIDMRLHENQEKVRTHLSKQFYKDNMPVHISEMTDLGLVQLTRKKSYQPLSQTWYKECPTCHGTGYVSSNERLFHLMERDILNTWQLNPENKVQVHLNQHLAKDKDMTLFKTYITEKVSTEIEFVQTNMTEHYKIIK